MGQLTEDLRTAVRSLRRWPALSMTAVAILAIGIGANTAVFSLAEQILNRSSPYRDAERLVLLTEKRGQIYTGVQSPVFFTWRDHSRTLEGLFAWGITLADLRITEKVSDVQGGTARPGFFEFLGVEPFLGRGLAPEGGGAASPRVIVLSHRLWRELYGGDPSALGQWLEVDGEDFEVVGVLPRGFEFLEDVGIRFWIPPDPNRQVEFRGVLGRLAQGVDRDTAAAELSTLAGEVVEGLEAGVGTIASQSSQLRPLVGLGWLSAAVLLIVCGTVASLLLARSELRSGELALRSALGAGRGRLTLQLLNESLLLALIAGGLGLLLALWMSEAILSLLPAFLGEWELEAGKLNLRHLAFTGFLSLVAGILCGVVPSWQASAPNLGSTLVQAAVAGSGKERNRWRQGLVVAKVTVSFSLLLWIVLVSHQMMSWHWRDLGFEPEGLWSLEVELPEERYGQWEDRADFYDQILEAITARRLPAGDSVTFGGGLSGRLPSLAVTRVEPECQPSSDEEQGVTMTTAAPAYFEVLGQPLRQGRGFLETDRTAPQTPVVINASLADRYWPNTSPIGRQIGFSLQEDCFRIVGVAQDANTKPVRLADSLGVYLPHWEPTPSSLTFIARSDSDDPALLGALRQRILALEPETRFTTYSAAQLLESPEQTTLLRFFAMVGLFVLAGVVLTAVGIYSIVTYTVSRRRAEIGVRMTFGARRWQILRSVVHSGLRPVALGIALGALLSLALSRITEGLIYGLDLGQPILLSLTALLLFSLCAVAAWIPARQATRVDPVVVLRRE